VTGQSIGGQKRLINTWPGKQSANQAQAGQISGAPGQAAEQPTPAGNQGSRCRARVVERSHAASTSRLPEAATQGRHHPEPTTAAGEVGTLRVLRAPTAAKPPASQEEAGH